MTELNDNALVRECLNGDVNSFEKLVDKYQKPVFNLAYRMTKSYDDAEDITQIVFITAYENLESFKPKYKFFSWLYRSAINRSLNLLNRKGKTEELNKKIEIKNKTYEEIINGIELSKQVQESLAELDINYRLVLVLKHFLDFSYQEISELIKVPEKTVKSRLYSARQIMKDILIKKKVF